MPLVTLNGFILATISIYVFVRRKGIHFLTAADAVAPGLLLGYGVARLGCHFAGDGDYGFPTTLPWGTDYSKGTYPPSYAFRNVPEIASKYPGGHVPDTILCHPTPVYELILCAILFLILWRVRKRLRPEGRMFMLYLVFAGAERFTIEFLRINPKIAFGMTEAQLIAVVLIITGAVGWFALSRKSRKTAP